MKQISTDPIADMLTRIRNANQVSKQSLSLPHSNLKESIAKILKRENYIVDYKVKTVDNFKELSLTLYDDNIGQNITEINRISKPGRRTYVNSSHIPVIKSGRGIVIVSTSKGLMTGQEAKKNQIGGELICKVY